MPVALAASMLAHCDNNHISVFAFFHILHILQDELKFQFPSRLSHELHTCTLTHSRRPVLDSNRPLLSHSLSLFGNCEPEPSFGIEDNMGKNWTVYMTSHTHITFYNWMQLSVKLALKFISPIQVNTTVNWNRVCTVQLCMSKGEWRQTTTHKKNGWRNASSFQPEFWLLLWCTPRLDEDDEDDEHHHHRHHHHHGSVATMGWRQPMSYDLPIHTHTLTAHRAHIIYAYRVFE